MHKRTKTVFYGQIDRTTTGKRGKGVIDVEIPGMFTSRDQLDRYGELTFVVNKIKTTISLYGNVAQYQMINLKSDISGKARPCMSNISKIFDRYLMPQIEKYRFIDVRL